MRLHVVAGDELPIYRQLMRQIADGVAAGRLKPGDRLPSIRELAEELVIAPLTIKKAYDELERNGLIVTRQGRGTFVNEFVRVEKAAVRSERLREPARRLAAQAVVAGISTEELLKVVEQEARALERERRKQGAKP